MNAFRATLLSASLFALTAAAQAQMAPMGPTTDHGKSVDGKPLASPAATATTTLAGKSITIKYHTPSMRGRTIMGGVVPYGQVWRTGANPATTLITEMPLKIGTIDLPAGTYTLYTLPAAPGTPWQLIINKQTGQWGTIYKQDMDFGRTEMKVTTLPAPQEVMSISFEHTVKFSTELHIRWENTDASVHVMDLKDAPRMGGVVSR